MGGYVGRGFRIEFGLKVLQPWLPVPERRLQSKQAFDYLTHAPPDQRGVLEVELACQSLG